MAQQIEGSDEMYEQVQNPGEFLAELGLDITKLSALFFAYGGRLDQHTLEDEDGGLRRHDDWQSSASV